LGLIQLVYPIHNLMALRCSWIKKAYNQNLNTPIRRL
jgi:hypothetical protein